MKFPLKITALLIAAAFMHASSFAADAAVEACVKRGVRYFKEVGSYPKLMSAPNKGRKAEDVARERCMRTTTAF